MALKVSIVNPNPSLPGFWAFLVVLPLKFNHCFMQFLMLDISKKNL